MDKIFEEIANLPGIKALLKLTGIDENYIFLLSLIVVVAVSWAIGIVIKKVLEWHGVIKKASDLKPEFEKDYIKDLSKIFIRTIAAEKSPNRYDNPGEAYKHTGKTYDLIDFMLKKSFNENVESNKYYLVLADSGMGKTSFMLNLYLQNYSYFNFFGNNSIITFFSVNRNSGVSINELEGETDCVLVVSYPVWEHGTGLFADSAVATSFLMIPFRKLIVTVSPPFSFSMMEQQWHNPINHQPCLSFTKMQQALTLALSFM